MISIIIPAYNHARELIKCLGSIFAQNYQNFEVIVVNDGSKDNTDEKIKLAQKKWPERILYFKQTNQGAPAARNCGFKQSRGAYLFFCDADAILKKDCLEKMINLLNAHPEASYVYSSFKFGWKTFKLWPFDAQKLKQMPYIHTMSLMHREHFPGFDESIKKLQDWDLWLTMLEQNHLGLWLPKILFFIAPRQTGISSWLPSFFYKIPWQKFGLPVPKNVIKYQEAIKIIKQKHHLS